MNKFVFLLMAVLAIGCQDQEYAPVVKNLVVPASNASHTISEFKNVQTAWGTMQRAVDAIPSVDQTDAAFLYFDFYTARIDGLGKILSALGNGSLDDQVAAIILQASDEADRDLTDLLATISETTQEKTTLKRVAQDAKSGLGKFKSELHDLFAGAKSIGATPIRISDTVSLAVRVLGTRPFVHTVWANAGDTIQIFLNAPSMQFPAIAVGVSDMLNGDRLVNASASYNFSVMVPVLQTSAYRISLLAENNEDAMIRVTETVVHHHHISTTPVITTTDKIQGIAAALDLQLDDFAKSVTQLKNENILSASLAHGIITAVTLSSNALSFSRDVFPNGELNNFKDRADAYDQLGTNLSARLAQYIAKRANATPIAAILSEITATESEIVAGIK